MLVRGNACSSFLTFKGLKFYIRSSTQLFKISANPIKRFSFQNLDDSLLLGLMINLEYIIFIALNYNS